MAKTYRLASAEFVHAPGLIRWAVNGYHFKKDRSRLLNVVTAAYGGLPRAAAQKLLSGKVKYKIEKDTVVFTA
jgi:hypothetical protein